jgi:predicted N-formylglutamate amidohydrolase
LPYRDHWHEVRALTLTNFPAKSSIVITCEHGGCQIPDELLDIFPLPKKRVLSTHEGWDLGALQIAKSLAKELSAPLFFSEVSRLVCDLNRTAHSSGPFARNIKPYTAKIPTDEFLARYYWPYRMKVEEALNLVLKASGQVLHLSIHSFTPKLKGEVRNADLGILYDPHLPLEKDFASRLKDSLQNQNVRDQSHSSIEDFYRIRLNYPYMGTDDGFTTYLRTIFKNQSYAGIEIEFNQARLMTPESFEGIYQFFKKSLLSCLAT